jgi:hypothetical protein
MVKNLPSKCEAPSSNHSTAKKKKKKKKERKEKGIGQVLIILAT